MSYTPENEDMEETAPEPINPNLEVLEFGNDATTETIRKEDHYLVRRKIEELLERKRYKAEQGEDLNLDEIH